MGEVSPVKREDETWEISTVFLSWKHEGTVMPNVATGKNGPGLNASGRWCRKVPAAAGAPHLPPSPRTITQPLQSTWAALALVRVRSQQGLWVRDWHLATQGAERDSQEPLCVPLATAPTHESFAECPMLLTGSHNIPLFYI